MSLGDKILNSVFGTNIHTTKVSAEQLAAIINDAFIRNATSREELDKIERTVRGSKLIFRRMDSEDGRFHLYVSYFERGLTQHRYVFVKNYETEEVFEWGGLNLGPLKRAVKPYLLQARINPPATMPPFMPSDFTEHSNTNSRSDDVNNRMDTGLKSSGGSMKKFFVSIVAITLLIGLVSLGYHNRFFFDRVIGTWKNVCLESKYETKSVETLAKEENQTIEEYQITMVFRSDGTVTVGSTNYSWKKENGIYQLYSKGEKESELQYTMEERDGKTVLVWEIDGNNKVIFSDDENLKIDDWIDYEGKLLRQITEENIKKIIRGEEGSTRTPSNNQTASEEPSAGMGSSGNSVSNDDYDNYEYDTDNDEEEEYEPFYGIWCGASKKKSEAEKEADTLWNKGLDAQVFVSSDWSNLNKEKWYVITAGVYTSKSSAKSYLSAVKKVYPDAYVKYSGKWQG